MVRSTPGVRGGRVRTIWSAAALGMIVPLVCAGGCAVGFTTDGRAVIGPPVGEPSPESVAGMRKAGASAGAAIGGALGGPAGAAVGSGIGDLIGWGLGVLGVGGAAWATARRKGERDGWDEAVGKPPGSLPVAPAGVVPAAAPSVAGVSA